MLTHGVPPDFRGRRPFIYLNRHTPLGQCRLYRFTQLCTNDVHCREYAGTGPVVLKVVPVAGAAFLQVIMDQLICASLFPHPLLLLYWYKVGMLLLYGSMALLQWGAPSSTGMRPQKTPALFRATGKPANIANTGTIESSKSLSSAGSGTTDDYLIVNCSAHALRGQQSTK